MDNFFLFWLIRQLSAVHLVAICAIALVLGIGRFALTALSESSESSLDASSREQQIIQLHDKHASVVRVAPGWYSISDPEAAAVLLTTIGSTSKIWLLKWTSPVDVHLFGPNSQLHTSFRMSKIEESEEQSPSKYPYNQYEAHIDSCIALVQTKLSECTAPVNLSHLVNCLVWDVMSAVTVGQPFGFLNGSQECVQGLIQNLENWNAAAVSYGQPLRLMRRLASLVGILPRDSDYLMSFIQAQLEQRSSNKTDMDGADVCDVLGRCADKAGTESLYNVAIACAANIVASSSATAVAIKSALFHLYTNRRTLDILRRELAGKEKHHGLSDIVTLCQAEKLRYLQAVVKEATRINTLSGLPAYFAKGRSEIASHEIPAPVWLSVKFLSKTSISASTIYHNKDIFGEDSSTFRPERWLAVTPERLEKMDLYLRQFGGDTFDLNIISMTKIIPQIVRHFDLVLEPGVSRNNFWAVGFQNFVCKVKPHKLTVKPQHHDCSTRDRRDNHRQQQGQGQRQGHGQGWGYGGRPNTSRSNQWNRDTRRPQEARQSPAERRKPGVSSEIVHPTDAAERRSAWNSLPTQLHTNEAAAAAKHREQKPIVPQEKSLGPHEEIFKQTANDGHDATTQYVAKVTHIVHPAEENYRKDSAEVATDVSRSVVE